MFYIVAAVVYAADRIIKLIVQTHLAVGQSVAVWPGVVGILYIRNPGAAWSIFAHDRFLLIAVELLVCAGIIYAKHRFHPGRLVLFGMALVLAGALGNVTDRIVAGTVVDYIEFQFMQFPIFNLADMSIDAGVILLLWSSFRSSKTK